MAVTHHKVPVNAVTLQTIITFAFGLGIGFWIGADQEFYFTGTAITLGLIFVYGAGNIGVIRYYLSEARENFNIWLHAIFPIACTLALIWVGYKSIIPLPAAPVKYAPFVVAGWLVAGLALMWSLSRSGREEWLTKATEIAYERPPTPEEEAAEGGSDGLSVRDQTIIVTGGGSGIGRAVALLAAARGARVGVTDLDGDAAGAVARSAGNVVPRRQCPCAATSPGGGRHLAFASLADTLGPPPACSPQPVSTAAAARTNSRPRSGTASWPRISAVPSSPPAPLFS